MSFASYMASLSGKRVAVIGIGISNRPLIEALLDHGVAVTACDKKEREKIGELADHLEARGCRLQLGEAYLSHLDEDVIFRTPGMRPDLPELKAAVDRGSVLTSEMEVFFEVCPCPIWGVTGSDGKTTTTTILAGLLQASGKRVHVGGNIGRPLLVEADSISADDVAVLELSSFQLMTMKKSPHLAIVTNISPNHLDVHKDYQEYISAKENIFTHQKKQDIAIFNADNDVTLSQSLRAAGHVRLFSRKHAVEDGVFLRDGAVIARRDGEERKVMDVADIQLPGDHNVENYLAAIAAVDGLVSDDQIRSFARTFSGVEHRIELIRERKKVRWYNDSIASSPSRTIAGLRSFPEKVILIAGGKDKGISYDALGPVINDHVKGLILCGATSRVIRESVERAPNYAGIPICEVEDYQQAVNLADTWARPGDVVILSPASTSFDRFSNFMERGDTFKKIVNALP